MVDEEHEDYIARFYLGQKIEEVLKGDLKRPFTNFNFQSCQNRRPAYSLLHKRMKLSSREEGKANFEKVANRVKQLEVTDLEMNTPMFCALQEMQETKVRRNDKSEYIKSVRH